MTGVAGAIGGIPIAPLRCHDALIQVNCRPPTALP